MTYNNSNHVTEYKHLTQVQTTCEYREFCREVFKKLKILPFSSQYIFPLLLFVVNNRDYLVTNSVYYTNNTSFGGIGVACRPLEPKFAGSNPVKAVRF
jgi:hypothetical protein